MSRKPLSALLAVATAVVVALSTGTATARQGPAGTPAMEIVQEQLGNVFLAGETVAVQVRNTRGSQLRWAVRDLDGNEVDRGITEVRGPTTRVVVDPGQLGYFTLDLASYAGVRQRDTVRTALAVLAPFDAPDDSRYGVQTHFGKLDQPDPVEMIPLLERLGVSFARDSVRWEYVEQAPGEYTFDPRFEEYITALGDAGVGTSLTLGLFNDLYDDGNTPYTEEGLAAFGAYAGEIARRYGDRLSGLEVWNEPNGQGFTRGPGARDPENYARMVEHVSHAVKPVDPDVPVVAGATTGIDLPWLEQVFQAGGLAHADAVSVHHYPGSAAGQEERMPALVDLVAQHAEGRHIPWWTTETGWPTFPPRDEEMIARDLIKLVALESAHGAARISWFNFKNNLAPPDEVPVEREMHFGLVRSEQDELGQLVPKPTYVSYAVLLRQLSDAVPVQRDPVGSGIRSYLFDRVGEQVRVLWALDGNHNIRLAGDGRISVTDMMGNVTEQTLPATVAVTGAPIYVAGDVASITPVDPRAEVEDLQAEVAPGTTRERFAEPPLSAGAGDKYNGTGEGDFVDYRVPVEAAGTYDVVLRMKTHESRGIYQLSVDGVDHGAPINGYSPGSEYQLVFVGKVEVAAAGEHSVRLTVAGKHPAATGYTLALDYLELIPADPTGAYRWEAEAVNATVTAGTSRRPFVDTWLSGNYGDKFNAVAVADEITYPLAVPAAGTYEVRIRNRTHHTRGIYQLSVDGVESGEPFDGYRPDAWNRLFSLGTVTFDSAGMKELTFTVIDKQEVSDGFTLALDYIELMPAGV